MTLDELVKALVYYQKLGHGDRLMVQHAHPEQLDPTDTREITGLFVGDDSDKVVLETVGWRTATTSR